MKVTIYEVHVKPKDEDDLPFAEQLTKCFPKFSSAIAYAYSLTKSNYFSESEIIIMCNNCVSLDYVTNIRKDIFNHGE